MNPMMTTRSGLENSPYKAYVHIDDHGTWVGSYIGELDASAASVYYASKIEYHVAQPNERIRYLTNPDSGFAIFSRMISATTGGVVFFTLLFTNHQFVSGIIGGGFGLCVSIVAELLGLKKRRR
jgi:hypothetical protein